MLRRSLFRLIAATGRFIQFQVSNLVESYSIKYPPQKPLQGQIWMFEDNNGQVMWSSVIGQIQADIDDLKEGGGNSGGGSNPVTPAYAFQNYLNVLSSLNPLFLARLNDNSGNLIFNPSDNAIGFYHGRYGFKESSVLLREGVATLDNQVSVSNFTVVLKFKANSSASGGILSYAGTTNFDPAQYDRTLFLFNDVISLYGFRSDTFAANYYDSSVNVRDNQFHTLIVRFGSDVNIWLDGNQIIQTSDPITYGYSGFWQFGYAKLFGSRSNLPRFANGIQFSGVAVFNRLLTSTEMTQIFSAVD